MVPTLPWLAAQAVSGQEALFRYLAGGRSLVERSLGMLESQFGFLKELDFHAEMSRKMADFGGSYVQGAPRGRAARRLPPGFPRCSSRHSSRFSFSATAGGF